MHLDASSRLGKEYLRAASRAVKARSIGFSSLACVDASAFAHSATASSTPRYLATASRSIHSVVFSLCMKDEPYSHPMMSSKPRRVASLSSNEISKRSRRHLGNAHTRHRSARARTVKCAATTMGPQLTPLTTKWTSLDSSRALECTVSAKNSGDCFIAHSRDSFSSMNSAPS